MRRAVAAGFLAVFVAAPARAHDFFFTDVEADCAARMIYMNECSGKEENLLYWSPQEPFPSLGIGHFIWYPEAATGPYLESFPSFLEFAEENELEIPPWVLELPELRSPWKTREEFLAEGDSPRIRELRHFLKHTKRDQAHFILQRFMRVFPSILADVEPDRRAAVRLKYDVLMKRREGTFAMVDYVNFKGEGFKRDARYEGVGWGLAQVLLEMNLPDDPNTALLEFIAAAEEVLERRVKHAPRPDVEAQWLPGWKNRVRGYLKIDC